MINVQLVENDQKAFQTAMEAEMSKALKHFEVELIKIRTGRAHTSLIEDIQVTVYGNPAPSPLKQLASLAAPDARLLTVQPWDLSIIDTLEKAINTSDLGIKGTSDGAVIKIVLPEMSSNRREELIKILGKKLEECRVSIRNVRRDFNELVRDGKKDKIISENFFNRLTDLLQKITDNFIAKAEQLGDKKEKEIRSV
jgi:ribosome recycling factor